MDHYGDLAERPEIIALTKCEGVDAEIIQMQKDAILQTNPKAKIFAISAQAGTGIESLLRELLHLKTINDQHRVAQTAASNQTEATASNQAPASASDRAQADHSSQEDDVSTTTELPVITLTSEQLSKAWKVEKINDKYVVTGPKIEKFARRTDLNNYESVNRLRDIMKKMGIRAELTSQGAVPESMISIAGKEFTLVEDW